MVTTISNNKNAISPFKEMAAYEALWCKIESMSFKKIADNFASHPNLLPSDFISNIDDIEKYAQELKQYIKTHNYKINVIINNTFDYPQKLRDAKYPIELLYYSGDISLLRTKGISVVGTRKPTSDGIRRTRKLVKLLINKGFTVYSGLAEGIDTIAHQTTIENSGRTVAVIGTPLTEFYPRNNQQLQLYIAKNHLIVSQVPFIKYKQHDYRWNRKFFPERNKTMSALSDATIIVEAGDTSGSLIQAKAAIEQNRKLFILQSCFENKNISWPSKYEKIGAIRVREFEDILTHLCDGTETTDN